MFAYKISGDTSTECIECTQEESVALQKQGYFISADSITWKNKKFNNGKLEDRPAKKQLYCYVDNGLAYKTVDEDYVAQSGEVIFNNVPTEQQLSKAFLGYTEATKHQKKLQLDAEYQAQYENLDKAYLAAVVCGNPTVDISNEKKRLMAEHLAKKEAIING